MEIGWDDRLKDVGEGEGGLHTILLSSDKYTMSMYGVSLKVGDPLKKIRTIPSYRSEYRVGSKLVWIYLGDAIDLPTFQVTIEGDQITGIYF